LYGAALAVLVAGSSAGCGGIASTPLTRQPFQAGSVQRPDVQFAPGEWTATGTILETDAADARPGEDIVRPWDFRRICENHSCRTIFIRQTLYGPRETPLEARGGRYVGVFPPEPTPCPHYPGEDAGTSQNYSTFTLWWSANHQAVFAMEHERYVGRNCGGGTESVRWTARRTNPSAAVPALGP
jgi:hypothetical protein